MKSLSKTFLLPLLAAVGLELLQPNTGAATTAYTLDTGGLRNDSELYLVGVLQGIVNRDAPRLFLTAVEGNNCPAANNTYVEYLHEKKGFDFVRMRTLNEAIAFFAKQKRADGRTPLIKGLVKYEPTHWDNRLNKRIDRQYQYWIAANFAAGFR